MKRAGSIDVAFDFDYSMYLAYDVAFCHFLNLVIIIGKELEDSN